MAELQDVGPTNLLAIYDLSLDGQNNVKPVREAKDCEDLAGALQDLPDPGECCRFYIAGNFDYQQENTLEGHLRKIVPLYNGCFRNGFNSLSTQWAKTKPSLHHALELVTANVTQDSFARNPQRGDLGGTFEPIPVTCSIGCYGAVDKAPVIVMHLIGGVLPNLSRKAWLSYSGKDLRRRHWEVFERYINVFLEENQEHRRCHHTDHSQEVRFKLYLLQFYRTGLRLYEEFSIRADRYSRRQKYMIFYSDSQTLAWSKAVADAADYDLYLEKATSMSIVAKSLVSLVRETSTEQNLTPEIKYLFAEVESLSDVITGPFTMLANRFARQMDLMNTSRNIQDSRDSRLLNLLACIFLPASLATSLLSMSTRFIDLGPLLYDFCGVIVLFASFLALIFLSFKVYDWTKGKLATRVYVRSGDMMGGARSYILLWKALLSFLLVIIWPMVLSSFVVGMVEDVGLGSRILGYGVAVVVGVTLILLIVTRNKWLGILKSEKSDMEIFFSIIHHDDLEKGVKEPKSLRQDTGGD